MSNENNGEVYVKKSKGKTLFVIACVAFVIALVVDLYWVPLWLNLLPGILQGTTKAGEALGMVFSILFIIPLWLISAIPVSLLAIILLSLSIKNHKVAASIMLAIIALLFIFGIVCFCVAVFGQPAKETTATLIQLKLLAL